MVRAVAAVVIALAGCGRGGFDRVTDAADGNPDAAPGDPDAPLGHDEDGDGIPDVTDRCPGIADPLQSDPDNDGVSDACDPEPANPRQSIALFSPLVGADARFTMIGSAWTQAADAWVFDGSGFGGLDCTIAIGNTDIWTAVDITAINPVASHQVAIHLDQTLDPHFYAEVYEISGATSAKLTRFAGGGFSSVAFQPLTPTIHTGPLVMHVQARVASGQLAFEGGWPGEPFQISGAAPEYAGGTMFDVAAVEVAVEVRYIMVIATAP